MSGDLRESEPREAPAAEERPREVYLAACDAIASELERDGFQYARSGPSLSQRSGDLTFRISFQSSHYNAAGAYVALRLSATVHSRRLKRWREVSGPLVFVHDLVAGGLLTNLSDPPGPLEWNLAGRSTRGAEVKEVVQAIRTVALPYFETFHHPAEVIARLEDGEIPMMEGSNALEYVLCFGDRVQASRVLQRMVALLDASPTGAASYYQSLERFRFEAISPWRPYQLAEQLARAAVVHGLDPPEGVAPGGGGGWMPRRGYAGEIHATFIAKSEPVGITISWETNAPVEPMVGFVSGYLDVQLQRRPEADLADEVNYLYVVLRRAPEPNEQSNEIGAGTPIAAFGFGSPPSSPEEWPLVELRSLLRSAIRELRGHASQ
jgi:hypothetical protein